MHIFYSLLNDLNIITCIVVVCFQLFKCKTVTFLLVIPLFYVSVIYYVIGDDVSDKISNYRIYACSIMVYIYKHMSLKF